MTWTLHFIVQRGCVACVQIFIKAAMHAANIWAFQGQNSENSLESGEIEGQDKLKDQKEKKDYERCRKHKY